MLGQARNAICLLVCVSTQLFVSGGSCAQQSDDKGVVVERTGARKWALLVGVDDYANLRPLSYCGADVRGLKQSLIALGFDQRRIVVLHQDADQERERPTKSNVQRELDLLLGELEQNGKTLKKQGYARKGDTIVIAFSGHGMHIDGTSYLCPAGARLGQPSTFLSLQRIYQQLSNCEADLKLMLVDACRNDPRPAGRRSPEDRDEVVKFAKALTAPPRGIMVLASCAPGQVSLEDRTLKHGVFMNFIMKGLSGAADFRKKGYQGNGNGRVSLSELFDFASQETQLFVKRKGELQTPQLWGTRTGVFEFGQYQTKPAASEGFTNSIGMKLVLIPAGEFQMGSRVSAAEMASRFDTVESHFADEHPLHQVKITRPFYLAACEVTLGQFRKFIEAANYTTTAEHENRGGGFGWDGRWRKSEEFSWKYAGWKTTDDHPVANVSWDDAVAFCEWLSRKEGQTYRLPTEAEWEYACRAGTDTLFFHGNAPKGLVDFGNVPDADAKNQFRNWATVEARDGYVFSAPVGRFKPNAFGLHDMHGNVWEWCSDAYGEDYYSTFVPGIAVDPKGPASNNVNSRVLRGGSWANNPLLTRCAARMKYDRDDYLYNYGFRVVCEMRPAKGTN